MTIDHIGKARWPTVLGALGAVLCAVAVGLAAYAAHAAPEMGKSRLEQASLMLFFHALSVTIFAAQQRGRWAAASLIFWLAGSVMFSGSLVLAVFFDTTTRFAPVGGVCFIFGWFARAGVFLQSFCQKDAALR